MPETSQAIQVNKEAVKLLVELHGQREGARLAGLNEDTVCSWAKRYGWSASKPQARLANTKLIENVQSQLANHAEQTKLGLSAYARRQAEHLASEGKLSDHGAFRNIASGASTLHGWNAEAKPSHFSLNVLNINTLSVDTLDTDS